MHARRHLATPAGESEATALEPKNQAEKKTRRLGEPVRFLIAFTAISLALISPVLTLNFLVDPLWYFSGNQITGHNEPFNERVSKLNLIRGQASQYDCVIFGPSVTTLIDASKLAGYRCFNAGFSDARVEELAAYASYMKSAGLEARLVIVDMTPRNFAVTRPRLLIKLPEFIKNGTAPTSPMRAYLSIEAFWFSLRSTLGIGDPWTWYDSNFTKHMEFWGPEPEEKVVAHFRSYEDFSTDALASYAELYQVWPKARRMGLVSFISALAVEAWRKDGVLEHYIKTSYAASRLVDEYYDFTAPSEITVDPDQTPDGLHYGPEPNDIIAQRLSGKENGFGIPAHQMSFDAFRERYLEAMEEWVPHLAPRRAALKAH